MTEKQEVLRTERKDALTEALVDLIRTGGFGSFQMISEKDRVFFHALSLLGNSLVGEEELRKEVEKVRFVKERLSAPKCAGCAGAPDLTGAFSLSEWEREEDKVRALKFLILSALCQLAPTVSRLMDRGIHVPELCEKFYRSMFVLGEDFSEEDLLQIAYGMDEMRKECKKSEQM